MNTQAWLQNRNTIQKEKMKAVIKNEKKRKEEKMQVVIKFRLEGQVTGSSQLQHEKDSTESDRSM